MIKRRMMKLVRIWGQRSRSPGTKKRKSAAFLGAVLGGWELCRPPVLRRWEISACCL